MTAPRTPRLLGALLVLGAASVIASPPPSAAGYYRFPAIHGNTIVFTAEGDLWRVGAGGGEAQRLTTHPGLEANAALSPDGTLVAFSAQYEGPTEVYVMPLAGGLPKRLTYEGENAQVRGWTPDGRVLYATRHYSTLPDNQLVAIDPRTAQRTPVPLAQADEGAYSDDGRTLVFTRYSFQGSHAKRYAGGTAQNLWRFGAGDQEAVAYHPEFRGTSRWPMWWRDRIYFASDRDGTMNLWSMKADGSDLRQHTRHADFGVKNPALSEGRIVYQNGADLWLYDSATDKTAVVPITLASDFDQLRETWVNKPADYVTAYALSPDGGRIALTVRGQVFVAPVGQGRLTEIARQDGVRYRQARFLPGGQAVLFLSDQSGEVEFWRAPANGVGPAEQLTRDGHSLRMSGLPSPDGKWLATTEHDQDLLVINLEKHESRKVAHSAYQDFDAPALDWSPDGKWLAYANSAASGNRQLLLYNVDTGKSTPVTSDRVNSSDPAFSPDGKWLYFLSERSFTTSVEAPWGPRQPEPFLDKPVKIYQLALAAERRSPFQPADELADAEKKPTTPKDEEKPAGVKPEPAKKAEAVPPVVVELEGIQSRLWEVPVPAGNYEQLNVTDKALFFLDHDSGPPPANNTPAYRLDAVEIKRKDPEVTHVLAGVNGYRLSADGKKLLLQQGENFFVIDAAAHAAADLDKSKVNLAGLRFPYAPRESWRQMFVEAWRLHRDYYYDRNMHGVDWKANLAKHLPLVDRVTDRLELNDLINYLISELSSLHTDANGGDFRNAPDPVAVATLGARWARDEKAGGYRLEHIYRGDPDFPDRLGPLQKPGVNLADGDVILAINGTSTLSVPDPEALLRNQAGRQVLLQVKPATGGEPVSRIVVPAAATEAPNLRYADWEYTRRLEVDQKSGGRIGYVHLRAMGAPNFAEWVRSYYASNDLAGLILDLRHNRGGNIESWIMSRLNRPAWMWWSNRDGRSGPNFQNPFRGQLVVIIDAWTASDGETMANGVRHLGLGTLLGVRTWGGGIWLTGSNVLVDRGLARAAEFGSFIPGEGWVVEGDGITPDVIVDNNPATAFGGADTQLDAAIKLLLDKLAQRPPHVNPEPPPYPDKTLKH